MGRKIEHPDQFRFKLVIKRLFLAATISTDWFSLRPWTSGGQPVWYIDHERQETGTYRLDMLFLGPWLVLIGWSRRSRSAQQTEGEG